MRPGFKQSIANFNRAIGDFHNFEFFFGSHGLVTIQDGCVLDFAAMCDPWVKSRVALTVWVTVMVSIVLEVAYQSRTTVAQRGVSAENQNCAAAPVEPPLLETAWSGRLLGD